MRPVFVLLAFVPALLALKCYEGSSATDSNYQPSSGSYATCPTNSMCIKTVADTKVVGNKVKAAVYGCDAGGEACAIAKARDGYCASSNGATVCCCSSDYCNSSKLSAAFSVIALIPIALKML